MADPKAEIMFGAGDKTADVLREWLKNLDRGGHAELGRTADSAEVAFIPGYHELVREILRLGRPFSREKLAAIAGLAARLESDTGDGASLATQMAARRSPGENAVVSGLRFRRVLAVGDNDIEDLYPMLTKILRLLGGKANLADLARSVYWWDVSTKKRWAYDYYAAAPSEK